MRLVGVLSLASFVGLSSVASSQTVTPGQSAPAPQAPPSPQRTPQRPLRPGEQPPKGTAVIRGQVRASGTGTPVRRAQVRAFSMEGLGGGITSTDGEGNFEIRELVGGRYTVSVTKAGFAPASFGQRRPNEPGTPIDLADGQRAEKVDFQLVRGGVIAGRIFDDGGEPVAGASVMAMRFAFVGGGRRLVPGTSEGGTDRTDDQGNFRLYGLPPGDYYVSASNRTNQFMSPGVNNTEPDGFTQTYFPGTPNVAEATRVTIKPGQEMSGANFSLLVARLARVRGRALNSRGEPLANSMLMLMPADPLMGMNYGLNMSNAMVAGDGSFQFANIAPGRYNLNVRPNGPPSATSEFATIAVSVSNDDIDNLIVTTSAGATLTGVIVTDDGSAPPFRASQVQIFPQSAELTSGFMGGAPAKINEDFSFEIQGLFDRRLLRGGIGTGGAAGSMGWSLKAVLFDGVDVIDQGIEFAPGRTYEGVQIVFTQKTTALSGLVVDDRNRPVLDATVVIFPADQNKWTYASRYLRTSRPDTNGRYETKSLPPLDDYLVIAVQNLEAGQASDPEFLSRAKEEAKPFSLTEGETKAVDIKLSKLIP